jgi:ABC-type sugar transport system permease subunit
MKNFRPLPLLLITLGVIASSSAYSQVHCNLLQANNAAVSEHAYNTSYWFAMMEIPFLFISVIFAFLTAYALKGGKFGKGMSFMAWGFLVMAVGHLHMQIEHYYGINVFNSLLGQFSGSIAWFAALIVTWGLSGLGFYSIYKASKGA